MNVILKSPEVKLWRAVILQAVQDSKSYGIFHKDGMEKTYLWTKTEDCKEVCRLAQLNFAKIRIGFANIYIEQLWGELKSQKRELKKNGVNSKQIDIALKPLRKKISDANIRRELIQCKKL